MLKYIIRTKDTVKPRRKFEIGLINFIHSTVSQSETIIIEFQPNDLDADELYEFLLQFEGGRRMPPQQDMLKLAVLYGVPVNG